jgi:hypothetical protein
MSGSAICEFLIPDIEYDYDCGRGLAALFVRLYGGRKCISCHKYEIFNAL